MRDLFSTPDWFPGQHPQMPAVVASGRQPDIYACAFCHLPNGAGRPENAPVAGLSSGYIKAQLEDFRSGSRGMTWHEGFLPTDAMVSSAKHLTDQEIAARDRKFKRPFLQRARRADRYGGCAKGDRVAGVR